MNCGSFTLYLPISTSTAARFTRLRRLYIPPPRLFKSFTFSTSTINPALSTPPTFKISHSKKPEQSSGTSRRGSQSSSSRPEPSTSPLPVYYNYETKTFFPSHPIRPITPSYMDKALEEPVTLTEPHKLLVILDLNGTLFYRTRGNNRSITPRPYLSEFLDFLFKNCRVMVWSSAQPQSVEAMLGHGFGNYVDRLDRIWNRTHFRLTPEDYSKKVLTIKDLEFVWEGIEKEKKAATNATTKHEKFLVEFDQTNTVLIDDSKDKIQLQPHNGLALRDFDVDLARSGTDNELPKVVRYLEKLTYQKNVSAYMRLHPFDTNEEVNEDIAKGPKEVETADLADVIDDLAHRLEKNTL